MPTGPSKTHPAAFHSALASLVERHEMLLSRPNRKDADVYNGIVDRFVHPVLTAAHTPLTWRFELDAERNPYLMERMGINAVFNPGAIDFNGRICLMCRVEGADRKSFFALAESETGIDRFRFRERPLELPKRDEHETNVYDMRLVRHEDGWIYGIFCTERRDPNARPGDLSAAIAQCGIVRTKDLDTWERLPDLQTPSPQQRNAVLHPEFVDGRYAFYTRPQDDFIDAGSGGGIGWGTCRDITNPHLDEEIVIEPRAYHTVKESKNGLGPAPLRTDAGWLHLAHGVRGTAAGLRYVLYAFLCALDDPTRVIRRPGGYLMAPVGAEGVGDVSNVLFANGWVMRDDGTVYLYYGSSDTRIHVATSSIERLLDYVLHTPEDRGTTHTSVHDRISLIERNRAVAATSADELVRRAADIR